MYAAVWMIDGPKSPSFERKKQTPEDLLREVYACGKSLTFCDEADRVGLAPNVAARTDNADVEVQAQSAVVAQRRGPVAADAACEADGSIASAATAVAGSRKKNYACILQSLEVIICICV